MATLSGIPPPSKEVLVVAGGFQATPGPFRVAARQMVLLPLKFKRLSKTIAVPFALIARRK